DGYSIQKVANQSAQTGFDNAALNVLYEFFENDKHEAITSIGLTWDIGGSGRHSLGNESFSTFTPTFYFGKGFGDLPDNLPFLRPFAVTGTLGLSIPTRAGNESIAVDPVTGQKTVSVDHNPDTLQWGLALEYNLIYLQQHVKDMGLLSVRSKKRIVAWIRAGISTSVDQVRTVGHCTAGPQSC